VKAKPDRALSVGSRTDLGNMRDHNEDSLLVKAPLYVIADGMGGHAAGEIASEIAIQTLDAARLDRLDPDALRRAVVEANGLIIDGAKKGLGRKGMGTTLTAAIIEGNQLLVAQVGDSRAYLHRNGCLHSITRDHSLVGELVSLGQLTEEEARVHPNRSVITRALGSDPSVQPDMYEMRLHEQDRLLLCSDGLNSMIDDALIEQVLNHYADPQDAADMLVRAAKDAGGYDNITVIVVNVDNLDILAAHKHKRSFKRGIIGFSLAFVLLVGLAFGGLYAYARNSAFLIDEGGYVALYRGLPGDFLGIELKWMERTTTIPVNRLNPTTAGELQKGISTSSLEEAERLISQFENQLKTKTSSQDREKETMKKGITTKKP